MGTLRAVLLGLVVTLTVTAGTGSAATSTCVASEPTANAKMCRVEGTSTGLRMTLLSLDPTVGQYRLLITSAKPERLTKLVRWTPPADMTITAITSVATGRCSLTGGRIACIATKTGPSLSLDFTVNGIPIELAPPPGREVNPGSDGEHKRHPDAKAFLGFLDPTRGLYRLTVENTSSLGFLNTFSWEPPDTMRITSITRSTGGRCTLLYGLLNCRGAKQGLARPGRGGDAGGALTLDFRADGFKPTALYNTTSCCVHILTMTPVPIAMGGGLPEGIDLPLCQQGQTSTKAFLCTKS